MVGFDRPATRPQWLFVQSRFDELGAWHASTVLLAPFCAECPEPPRRVHHQDLSAGALVAASASEVFTENKTAKRSGCICK